jgi:hypothetical protein
MPYSVSHYLSHWLVINCNVVGSYQRFGGTSYLHLQGVYTVSQSQAHRPKSHHH